MRNALVLPSVDLTLDITFGREAKKRGVLISRARASGLHLLTRIFVPNSLTKVCQVNNTLVPQTPGNCGTSRIKGRRGSILLGKTGAPGAIPTRDLPLRRRTLYAAELREHNDANITQLRLVLN